MGREGSEAPGAILRHPGDPRKVRGEKVVRGSGPRKFDIWSENWKKCGLIHESGLPRGSGTGSKGVHLRDVGSY